MPKRQATSSPSPADPLRAAWEHGLSPFVVKRLRLLIPSLEGHYDRLAKAAPSRWGYVLARYALFQRLRRREGEAQADHRARQARFLCARHTWEWKTRGPDIRSAWPETGRDPEIALGPFAPLGAWIVAPELVTGSELEEILDFAPTGTGRVLVLDIAADKVWMMAQISRLIDREREVAGITPSPRRGRKRGAHAMPDGTELGDFLRSVRDHRIVQLWDLQLAGRATDKTATARVLYPERAKRIYDASRSVHRVLLQKLDRACELQDKVKAWLPRLLATER
jgi:hypothetical protein